MKNKFLGYMAIIALLFMGACEEDEFDPVLTSDASQYISAELVNEDATFEVTEDNISDVFQTFSWTYSGSDYGGIKLTRQYELQLDLEGNGFVDPTVLRTTSETEAVVTVSEFNAAVLGLGALDGIESNVVVRLRTIVPNFDIDTLYSDSVTYSITPFLDTQCGLYCTMGIIGNATAADWDDPTIADIDMRLADPENDLNAWTYTGYFSASGGFKFRADDSWNNNWGSSATAGIAEAPGDNFSMAADGYYKIDFNVSTLEYTFTPLTATTYTSIGLVGPGSPAGDWPPPGGAGVDATLSPVTGIAVNQGLNHVWQESGLVFTDGDGKVRANGAWDVSWGMQVKSASPVPSAYLDGGEDVGFSAGTYTVRFNDVSGEIMFITHEPEYNSIGIVGTANGQNDPWNTDVNLKKSPVNPYFYSGYVTLVEGEMKLRANGSWDNNWGSFNISGGVATHNPSGGNVVVPAAGRYFITFNSGTGEVNFIQ